MVNDDGMTRLQARIDELEQLVAQLLMAPPPAPPPPPAAAPAAGDDIEFVYPNVEAWVLEEFAPIHIKPIGGDFRWCPKWWDHIEAVSRFEALWRAWERLRLDPAFGMATWYRDFLDISLNGITGPRGPFARCSPERHEPPKPLPVEAAPAGYWDWPDATDPSVNDAMAAYWGGEPSWAGQPEAAVGRPEGNNAAVPGAAGALPAGSSEGAWGEDPDTWGAPDDSVAWPEAQPRGAGTSSSGDAPTHPAEDDDLWPSGDDWPGGGTQDWPQPRP